MSVALAITGGLVHLSGNPIEVVMTASAPRDNHRLAVKVSCSALLSPVQVEEYEPASLVARADIHGLVNEPLASVFDYPMLGKVSARIALALLVTVDAGEVWDDENGDRQESWAGINTVIRVLNGRLRDYELQLLNDAGKSFASEFITGGRFLTNLPQNTVVAPNQGVKLWYLSRWTENHDCQLNFQVETDNKVAHIPITEAVTLIAQGLFEFSMNPSFIGYHTDPGEKVVAYTFWLSDESGDITEKRRFVVDNNYYERSFFGYYRNKFSAIESFWLRGESKEKLKTESESAYKPAAVGAGSKVATMITVSSGSRRYWELNTGIRSRTEMLAMRELLEAQECWLVDPDNTTKLIPVTMESSDALLYDSMEDIQSLEITLFEAHKK